MLEDGGLKTLGWGAAEKRFKKAKRQGQTLSQKKRRNDVGKFIVGFVFQVARSFTGKTQQAK